MAISVDIPELQTGWLDGWHGSAVSTSDWARLKEDFREFYADHLSLPYLYPTAEGGIQIEWSVDHYEITLEFASHSRMAEWQSLNLETHHCLERDLEMDDPASWRWIVEQLVQAAAGRC